MLHCVMNERSELSKAAATMTNVISHSLVERVPLPALKPSLIVPVTGPGSNSAMMGNRFSSVLMEGPFVS